LFEGPVEVGGIRQTPPGCDDANGQRARPEVSQAAATGLQALCPDPGRDGQIFGFEEPVQLACREVVGAGDHRG
jgi:hypothetical protein